MTYYYPATLFFAGFSDVPVTWHIILSQNFMLDLLIFMPLDIFSWHIFFCWFYYLPRKFVLVIPMFLPLAILSCQIISLLHLIMFLPLAILSCHIIFEIFLLNIPATWHSILPHYFLLDIWLFVSIDISCYIIFCRMYYVPASWYIFPPHNCIA